MPSTFSPVLDLELMQTGEDTSVWGTKTNSNLSIIDSRLGGVLPLSVAGNSDITLTSSQAKNFIHELTGALTGNINYIFPNGGVYFIENGTSGAYTITVKTSGGTGIVVPQGTQMLVVLDTTSAIAYATFPIPLTVAQGGTGATTASGAITNLGAASLAGTNAFTGSNDFTGGSIIVPTQTAGDSSTNAASTAFVMGAGLPTGAVIDYAGSSAPAGWLLCYGQLVSTSTYAALYAVLGTTYGSGSGTFGIPDYRGRIGAGIDNMGGGAANRITSGTSGITGTTLGATGGNQALHGHTHTASVTDPGHVHTETGSTGGGGGMGLSFNPSAAGQADLYLTTEHATTGISVSNSSTGAGSSQNVQPTIMINKIIKT